ncbi:BCCT family transporter [Synergistes jonesii]|uniref:BCCT transporter n=1 Tax=Synergistes jonesii TaxID=2754 RepID=A0A073INJ1_9BACT|nr:BCCT family transporter [Synergistes jonesii]KEJ91329.1 hypothetical protein EH55_10815 [Synergistes jonesii]OFB60397.1 hypothetical protein JS73_11685 [Synergistes jonesii]OFB61222.1 hypothetical protein JS79_11835 [Synergistes jonesii]OFB62895.1 hypothetical protein JS72_07595 [Synergistes jonesii]OFB66608.1 hypothetical protein JS78_11705 [Synergistes jonesii]
MFNVLNKKLFVPVAIILGALFIFGITCRDAFCNLASLVLNWGLLNLSWCILGLTAIMGVILLCMVFSDFGKKIIGGADAKPLYSTFTWIAMAICSSIGIAMMFYAVVEPLGYFYAPPVYLGIQAETNAAALNAVAQSTFHWSLMYYAIQIFWGIVIVYMSINKGLPFRPSAALYPLVKNKIFGLSGTVIDILCCVSLVCGTITCFGLGTMQFSTGLAYVSGFEVSNMLYFFVVVAVTICFSFSSARGISKGMAILSNLNTYLYMILLAFLIIFGPTVKLFELLLGSLGTLCNNFFPAMFNGDFIGTTNNFANFNTSYYFIWTLVFSPVAGMFYAKIARGRSIRTFIIVNWLVPTAFILVWFNMWGGCAIYQQFFNHAKISEIIAEWGAPVANFALLDVMPLRILTIPATLIAVIIGFMTMADALTGIVASMTVKKSRAEAAPIPVRLFWGFLTGGLTLICLFVLDKVGTVALQSLAVAAGIPLLVVTTLVCYGSIKLITGEVDHIIDETQEGREALELTAKETEE